MEVVERDKPLQILEDKSDMQSIIIGELKTEEGLMPTTSHIEPTSDKGLLLPTYAEKDSKLTSIVKIVAVNMKLINPSKGYYVSQQQLLQLPKSKYRSDNYYDKVLSLSSESVTSVHSKHGDSDVPLPYSTSGEKSPLSHPVLEPSLPNKHADSDTTFHTHHLMKLYHIGITVRTIGLKTQRSVKISKTVENLPNVHLKSASLVLENAADIIFSNVKDQNVIKLLTK